MDHFHAAQQMAFISRTASSWAGDLMTLPEKAEKAWPDEQARRFVQEIEAKLSLLRPDQPTETVDLDLQDPQFQRAIQWTLNLVGRHLGAKEWEGGDGSETVEGDVSAEINNIMRAAGLVDGHGDVVQGPAFRQDLIERCAVAAEAQDRTGREWVKDSLWDNILERAGANVRTLHGDTPPPSALEDRARLDWLDQVNANANDRNKTTYGWRFDINHNRAALTDHNHPALSVREAIDVARGALGETEAALLAARRREA